MQSGIVTVLKVLGPDDINFSFIKEFWPELKGDLMRFISEFHRNIRLTKGIKYTLSSPFYHLYSLCILISCNCLSSFSLGMCIYMFRCLD